MLCLSTNCRQAILDSWLSSDSLQRVRRQWRSRGIPQVFDRSGAKQQGKSCRHRRDRSGLRQARILSQRNAKKVFRDATVAVFHAKTAAFSALSQRLRRLGADSEKAQKQADAGRRALFRRQSRGREFYSTVRLIHRY